MLKDLVLKNRSYRRFYQNEEISQDTLKGLIELARTIPSAGNFQVLKFILVNSKEQNEKVFKCLGFAAALPDWDGPIEGEKPSSYIIILCDNTITSNLTWKQVDEGIAAQTIMLGANELGLGGCIFGNIKRQQLAKELNIDTQKYTIDLVLAIGKPKEEIKIVDIDEYEKTQYYRDKNMVHYVPKRKLKDLIINIK